MKSFIKMSIKKKESDRVKKTNCSPKSILNYITYSISTVNVHLDDS